MKRFLNSLLKKPKNELKDVKIIHETGWNNASYSWDASTEEDKSPNPEELLAAAHASCFTLKLGIILRDIGYDPKGIKTASTIRLEGSSIAESNLVVRAEVPGISIERFAECAEKAKNECLISKALNMQIFMDAAIELTGQG